MGIVSIELVPRSEESLLGELNLIRDKFPAIETINIPDLLNFDLRSWTGSRLAQKYFPQVIPHLRAIDFDLENGFPEAEIFAAGDFESVLVITGDHPQDMSRRTYRTTAPEMISALKRIRPQLKVYAGIDPYRSGVKAELDYVRQKIDAGADGFFTQPFFDLRLVDIYNDLLEGLDVFWGVCPVTSERSRDYWENLNNAIFPPDFDQSLDWNRRFARQMLEFCERTGGNLYFMPIRTDLVDYLDGILN